MRRSCWWGDLGGPATHRLEQSWVTSVWGPSGAFSPDRLAKPRTDFRFEVSLLAVGGCARTNALSAAQTAAATERGRTHVPIKRPINCPVDRPNTAALHHLLFHRSPRPFPPSIPLWSRRRETASHRPLRLSSATWTPDRIEQLRACVGTGMTCSQIAAAIGVSRNAVIGKIHRLGLSSGRPAGAGARVTCPPRARHPRVPTQRRLLRLAYARHHSTTSRRP